MKTRELCGLAIVTLFIGGLLNISWVALFGIAGIGICALTFEFVSNTIKQDNIRRFE
jgi:hypothetical protein